MSHGEAGLVTDKAINCEQFHSGAWETRAQRGGRDPFGTGGAGLAYFSLRRGPTPGLPPAGSPVLRDGGWLPNLAAGRCVGKVMLWEPAV